MDRSKKRKVSKILAWCNARIAYIISASRMIGFPKTDRQAREELQRRKYPVGQWHRWYQANKRYQKLTGKNLYRWQVR